MMHLYAHDPSRTSTDEYSHRRFQRCMCSSKGVDQMRARRHLAPEDIRYIHMLCSVLHYEMVPLP